MEDNSHLNPPGSAKMKALGARGGRKTKSRVHKVRVGRTVVKVRGKEYYSMIAKLSHPKNNPAAKRNGYVGGRPGKDSQP